MIAVTGSNLAAIVIPIVVMFSLAVWIVMVFHADSHPLWQERTSATPDKAPARHSPKVPARSAHRPSLTHGGRAAPYRSGITGY
jgi:hypothetical protein